MQKRANEAKKVRQTKYEESVQQNGFSLETGRNFFKILPEFWRFMRRGCN